MKRTPAEDIVGFLNFSRDHRDRLNAIEKFTPRQWKRALQWLDDAGLAFYFLQKLKDTNATDVVSPLPLSRLERNYACNQLRVADMSHRFDSINKQFTDAGVHYTAIKGFSLVPQFCPHAPLRYQADFDYLVEEESLPAACRVLMEAGYGSKDSRSSKESIFITPGGQPSRGAEQYSPQAPHAVELHTEMWDSNMHRLPPIPNLFSVAEARTHHWNGFTFHGQTDEDAFLLQVLHACRHLFTQWIRASCLYEIGYFLHRRASDTELWSGIEQRAGDSAVLREFVVIVTELAARLFAAPVPELVQTWGARVRPAPRTWVEHYGRDWALCRLPVYEFSLFPPSKLALLLYNEYKIAPSTQESQHQNKSSSSRTPRITTSIRRGPSPVLNRRWWNRHHLIRRATFYVLAELRYICEIPHWKWLNRASLRTVPAPWTSDSLQSKKAS
ncbi:MAG TPA: nucleotidyltransferase family protein [Candidatus Sulfotelmatobacter sp.]|nr:nucleotidyltransferase family protein [Candidatus Sulfotelmatobacter sp.]